MGLRTITWANNKVKIIDQTELPARLRYLYIKDLSVLWKAIKELKVRGAPALGAAAALGCFLGIRNSKAKTFSEFMREMEETIRYIGSSRPTARNLFWGLERARAAAVRSRREPVAAIKKILLREAQTIIEEDRTACRSMGTYGAKLLKNNDTILTICNTGILATIDYGTALGVIYRAQEQGKKLSIYVCETRPLLQGARLTAWELKRKGIDVTLICDSMAATLMKMGRINKVITGADRIAANGDTANKIGTYTLAVLCRYHAIPFFVAAPASTFDVKLNSGKGIPIEERGREEVVSLFFKRPITAEGVKVFNPAFDVTPSSLITAIITDKGIIRPPYTKNIKRIVRL